MWWNFNRQTQKKYLPDTFGTPGGGVKRKKNEYLNMLKNGN